VGGEADGIKEEKGTSRKGKEESFLCSQQQIPKPACDQGPSQSRESRPYGGGPFPTERKKRKLRSSVFSKGGRRERRGGGKGKRRNGLSLPDRQPDRHSRCQKKKKRGKPPFLKNFEESPAKRHRQRKGRRKGTFVNPNPQGKGKKKKNGQPDKILPGPPGRGEELAPMPKKKKREKRKNAFVVEDDKKLGDIKWWLTQRGGGGKRGKKGDARNGVRKQEGGKRRGGGIHSICLDHDVSMPVSK